MQDNFELDPVQWATLRRLLDDVLALPAAQRQRWVDTLDPALVGYAPRLRALLAHADSPAVDAVLVTLPKIETAQFAPRPEPAGARTPQRVGPYRLLRELGSGGMASVWLAERSDMLQGRQVALKLPHGAWRRSGLAERMAREREILATLEHANIARLYDAGVAEDGQPYLALEYVEGERIDRWCEHRQLDVSARLHLFLQVARAVAHAHAHLVVHRDLKPANILVTEAGEVKLLDFGIAKLLDQGVAHETELTQGAGRALTPEYAAPEQILGQPVGTAADVYALGVVLFELLAGARPYALKRESRAALEDAIASAEPARPSAVAPAARRRSLRGDLDTIVLKALKKAPALRYATVDAFAEDIERYLTRRPVRAQPDRALYRLRKFVARNRLVVGMGTTLAVAIVAGAAAALWQARVALAEQRRADLEARHALQSARVANANTTLADFLASDLANGRSTTDLEAQLERAAVMVRAQYAQDPLARAHLMAGLSGRMMRVGNFERYRALAGEAEAAAGEAGDAELVARLACTRARDTAQRGDIGTAQRVVDAAIPRLEALDPPPAGTLARCLADASAIARLRGDGHRAIETAERIRAIEVGAGIARTATHADTMLILARAYGLSGRYRDALAAADRGIALSESLGTGQTPAANNLRGIRATMLRDGGQPARALAALDALLADHAARGGSPRTLAAVSYDRAITLILLGRHALALPAVTATLDNARAQGDSTLIRASSVGRILALTGTGQFAEARRLADQTAPLYLRLRADRVYTARLYLFALAELALGEGDLDAAAQAVDEARALLARAGGPADPAARTLHRLQARIALAHGRPAQAVEPAQQALALAREQAIDPAASLYVGEDLLLLARTRSALGDADGARADARAARAQLQGVLEPAQSLVDAAVALAR